MSCGVWSDIQIHTVDFERVVWLALRDCPLLKIYFFRIFGTSEAFGAQECFFSLFESFKVRHKLTLIALVWSWTHKSAIVKVGGLRVRNFRCARNTYHRSLILLVLRVYQVHPKGVGWLIVSLVFHGSMSVQYAICVVCLGENGLGVGQGSSCVWVIGGKLVDAAHLSRILMISLLKFIHVLVVVWSGQIRLIVVTLRHVLLHLFEARHRRRILVFVKFLRETNLIIHIPPTKSK